MTGENISALMADAGARADMLLVDEDQDRTLWRLIPDDETLIWAEHDEARQMIVLSTDIGAPCADDRARMLELALRYQHAWRDNSATRLSLSEDEFWLSQDLALADLEVETLSREIIAFTTKRNGWRHIFGNKSAGAPRQRDAMEARSTSGLLRT